MTGSDSWYTRLLGWAPSGLTLTRSQSRPESACPPKASVPTAHQLQPSQASHSPLGPRRCESAPCYSPAGREGEVVEPRGHVCHELRPGWRLEVTVWGRWEPGESGRICSMTRGVTSLVSSSVHCKGRRWWGPKSGKVHQGSQQHQPPTIPQSGLFSPLASPSLLPIGRRRDVAAGGLGAATPLWGSVILGCLHCQLARARGLGINPIWEEVIKSPFGSLKCHAAPSNQLPSVLPH